MTITASELVTAIKTGRWTRAELDNFREVVRYANAKLGHANMAAINVGDVVSFIGRRGITVVGTVEKLKQKNLTVLDNKTKLRWNVAASFVTKV